MKKRDFIKGIIAVPFLIRKIAFEPKNKNLINGHDLRIWVGGVPVGYAKTCSWEVLKEMKHRKITGTLKAVEFKHPVKVELLSTEKVYKDGKFIGFNGTFKVIE